VNRGTGYASLERATESVASTGSPALFNAESHRNGTQFYECFRVTFTENFTDLGKLYLLMEVRF